MRISDTILASLVEEESSPGRMFRIFRNSHVDIVGLKSSVEFCDAYIDSFLEFEIFAEGDADSFFEMSDSESISIKISPFPEIIQAIAVKSRLSEGGASYVLKLARAPSILMQVDRANKWKSLVFSADEIASVLEFNGKEFSFEKWEHSLHKGQWGFEPSHFCTLADKSGEVFSVETARKEFHLLRWFYCFVHARRIAFESLYSENEGQLVHFEVGIFGGDRDKVLRNWFHYALRSEIQNIYKGYREAHALFGLDLIKIIEFYRVSSVIRSNSQEVAYVSAISALELLSNTVLSLKAGWSRNLVSRSNLDDKIRATFGFLGLGSDFKLHEKLRHLEKEKNFDSFQVIVFIRNQIVHSIPGDVDTRILFCAWSVSMWLIEIFLLCLFGHKGGYQDRRQFGGYAGLLTAIKA
ncbi:hypothetical protein [Oharaeibacter diazotrophicus]|uniref:hypothetical protein n=1 Tax=Oharaeibacter diazotrophicus TaxID=1920512 RepID=UPI000F83E06F|nr:hypothetical protein [Oharaeibacter diazotrophicus]GLS76625.1 hypothetical protein GCM10007904_19620 [Oharaeibacter diazotrophicus]